MMINQSSINSKSKIAVFLDFDETLITNKKELGLIEKSLPSLLEKLNMQGVLLYITSRNPPYVVKRTLNKLELSHLFVDIIADFRKKNYHVKEALFDLKTQNITIDAIIFIDDFQENCRHVDNLKKEIKTPIYSIIYTKQPPYNLKTILSFILENNLIEIRKLSI